MENLKINADQVLDKDGNIQSYPIGAVIISINSTIPEGWLLCDGSVYNVSDYPALGSHLGATYGGNGSTTFGVPPIVNNANPKITTSTLSSEPAIPSNYGHAHNVSTNARAFGSHSHAHNHNSWSGQASGAGTTNHAHSVSGNTSTSSNAGGSESRRATGPNGPYASGPSGGTGHSHGGAGWSAGTNAVGWSHTHGINYHSSNITHTHNHNVAVPTSAAIAKTATPISSQYPLSREVYFLIKH
jgi:microcystin-dependent protein